MRRQLVLVRVGAPCVEVVKHQNGDAAIHQCPGDGAPGAAGADLHHRLAVCMLAPETFHEAVAPAAAIEVVAVVRPSGAIATVLTAPTCTASGPTASSSGMISCLNR
jgi:hypothetical protein